MATRPRTAVRATIALLAIVALAVAAIVVFHHGHTTRSHGRPLAMLQADAQLEVQPARTLQTLRSLGVGVVRVSVFWNAIAPDPLARRIPRGFDSADPAAYPAAAWRTYDAIARDARRDGIELDFLLTGGAPLWATGHAPRAVQASGGWVPSAWEPSAERFGDFVHAVALRYSGAYTPPGARSPLPRVHFWEIWNEPNWNPELQPQIDLHPLRIASAAQYRHLVDAAWTALAHSGHGRDTVVIGSLSPRGVAVPPDNPVQAATAISGPFAFTRALYCVDDSYRQLHGAAARQLDCPPTSAGSARFRIDHPALFQAAGFGLHPYPITLPPTKADPADPPDTVEFSEIPTFSSALDRLQQLYGSHRKIRVYNTEYGYVTNPPNPARLHAVTAARYLNWAEYLTWRSPRVATTMQYLLYDPSPTDSSFGPGGFATGLFYYGGKPKPTFYAYRMPLFLPVDRGQPGDALEVWGCARPAPYAYIDTHTAQHVQIQFRPASGGGFHTLRTVRLTPGGGCYFDVNMRFPGSGFVRLAWSYPRGDRRLLDPLTPGGSTIYSRQASITMH
jgi:hypothetical protein